MNNNYKSTNNNLIQAQIRKRMTSLLLALETLAPHPDRPHDHGPLLIKVTDNMRLPAEYDGMLGSMILDMMLGSAFAQAANDHLPAALQNSNIDYSMALDMYSAYLEDREEAKEEKHADEEHAQKHGRGSFARLFSKGKDKKAGLAEKFNAEHAHSSAMNNYLRDLPRRRQIETALAELDRELQSLEVAAYSMPACAA